MRPNLNLAPVPAKAGGGFRWRCSKRALLRGMALALFVALAWPLPFWPGSVLIPPATSPFTMIGAAIAARGLGIATLAGLPFLLLILLRQRGFCRYLCPVGTLIDVTGWTTSEARRWVHLPARAGDSCDQLESAPGANRASGSSLIKPMHPGQWIALLTLGGALVGWPLFLWLDPMALFSGFFGMFNRPLELAGVCAGLGLPAVLVLSVFRRSLWCGRLCPLGGVQDLSWGMQKVTRRQAPASPTPWRGPVLARRSAISLGVGALGTIAARSVFGARPKGLRPPGAIGDPEFSALCVRCGSCVRVCPSRILHPDPGAHGVTGLLAPVLRFEDKYCREDCCRCGTVCPSGAIRRFGLADKPRTVIGRPVLEYSLCRLFYPGSGCSGCIDSCPYGAIQIVPNADDSRTKPIVLDDRCNGCGACEVACPARPKALVVKSPPR